MNTTSSGLSDPFVIVELCPHHLFPMAKSQRTQVKLKTLHPVFDELFYLWVLCPFVRSPCLYAHTLWLICLIPLSSSHVSPEQYRHRFACLTFTVMDYDWLSTNDFAGEAVAPLSDFCWPGRPNASAAGKSVQPVILHLSRSKPSGTYGSGLYHLFCFLFFWVFLGGGGLCRRFVYSNIMFASWRPGGVSLGFQLLLQCSMKSHSIKRYLCQV